MTTSCSRWAHIFRALAHHSPAFSIRHRMTVTPKGLTFRTAVPFGKGYYSGCLFRQMFAVLPDGRIFGPRNREVGENILIAWMNDENGMDDIL